MAALCADSEPSSVDTCLAYDIKVFEVMPVLVIGMHVAALSTLLGHARNRCKTRFRRHVLFVGASAAH